jgi:glycosyltransferase involved in cell wall biosynthesis
MAYKVAVLLSHPVQYFSPLWRELAADPEIELMVYYGSDEGARTMQDVEFGRDVKWDTPLLDGYTYKVLKNDALFPGIFKGPFGLVNGEIVREISVHKFDAIIIHSWSFFTEWLAFVTALVLKVPVFLRVEMPLNQELLKSGWKCFIKERVFSFLFKKVSAFLYIGTENKKFYESYRVPEKKMFFTPYAVENDRLIRSHEELRNRKYALRKEIGIFDDKIVVLFVGKFIEKKRVMDLVRAFEALTTHNKALVLVGDGPLRMAAETYVADKGLQNVHFAGFKNQTELPAYYAMADIFVLPSDVGETWGLVVNEAMCFGLPVIVSETAGCSRDLVKDGDNGLIVKTGDVGQLSGALSRLIEDPGMRARMGARSLQMVATWSYAQDKEGLLAALRAKSKGC